MELTTRTIGKDRERDINIPNEPFSLYGRMIPTYDGRVWRHTAELFPAEEVSEMCFPDENYSFNALAENSTFIGLYDGETCVGLAILQEGFCRYMYLYDLKVNRAYRRQGGGGLLMEAAGQAARAKGYRGIWTQGQDNNLAACQFYLRHGFVIGGMDTMVYTGTSQEGKSDILFYLDF